MIDKYDDKKSAKAVYFAFVFVQMFLLSVTYAVVYTAFRATEFAVERFELNAFTAYAPTVILFLAAPFVLYYTRRMFRQGQKLNAVIWMMGLLSMFLVGLMIHLGNITGV